MATLTSSLMTFEEFELLPERPGKQELLQGELIQLPRPKRDNNEVTHRIFLALVDWRRHMRNTVPDLPIGKAYIETSYRVTHNPDSSLVPDVSFTHPNQPGKDYYDGAPLLAVEVVSPSNLADQIEGKISVYLENGATEVWIVYPKRRYIRVYRDGGDTLVRGTLRTVLLPNLAIDLEALFAD